MAKRKPATHTCCQRVYDRGSWSMTGHICGRGARYEKGGNWYCKTHHPDIVAEKSEARVKVWKEKWEEQSKARQLVKDQREQGQRALELVKRIAQGHNDPRSLCLEFLTEFNLTPEDGE